MEVEETTPLLQNQNTIDEWMAEARTPSRTASTASVGTGSATRRTTSSSTRWCFTLNNPGDWRPALQRTPEGFYTSASAPMVLVHYMIYQLESGEEETPHLQGYLRLSKKIRMTQVKSLLGSPTMHLELAKGTEQQNKDYCSKVATQLEPPTEIGLFDPGAGRQGHRTDLLEATKMLSEGKSLKEVAIAFPSDYVRYHQGLQAYKTIVQPLPPSERNVKVVVLHGPTGTGKTHRAMTQYPDAYVVSPGRDPWYGYEDQATVIFDEFDYNKWTIQELNRYWDKWRCSLDCRYHNKFARWTLVIVCSNVSPYAWYPLIHQTDYDLWMSLRRRQTVEITVLTKEEEINISTL